MSEGECVVWVVWGVRVCGVGSGGVRVCGVGE